MMSGILHFADLHLDDSTEVNASKAMAQMLEIAHERKPALIVNAGDLVVRRGTLRPWVAYQLRRFHNALADVAPVLVVAGNHDLVGDGGIGVALGALGETRHNITVVEGKPEVVRIAGYELACLPYPSVAWMRAHGENAGVRMNAQHASELLAMTVKVLADQCQPGAILVYHGTVAGATLGGERQMLTGDDIMLGSGTVRRADFYKVLAGHIHKPQVLHVSTPEVCVYYPGSSAPLGFGEDHEHGLWWHPDDGDPLFITLKPVHRFVTIEVNLESMDMPQADVEDALVRVKATASAWADVGKHVPAIRANLKSFGAASVRFAIERAELEIRKDPGAPVIERVETFTEALGRWIEREKAPRDAVLEFMGQVELGIPPEARASGAYALTQVGCSDFKSLGNGPWVLDLATMGKLVCIEGPNASGKSNITEVEAFALWGRLPRGRTKLEGIVRRGASSAKAWVEFHVAGTQWKVTRTVETRGASTYSTLTLLARGVAPTTEWFPAGGNSAAETQEKINALAGSFELYLSTRYAGQGDIDRLLKFTPAETKDALVEALGLGVFDLRLAKAKALITPLTFKIHGLRGEIAGMEQTDDVMEAMIEKVNAARFGVAAKAAAIVEQELGLEGVRAKLERAVAASAAQEAARNAAEGRKTKASQAYVAATGRLARLRGELERRRAVSAKGLQNALQDETNAAMSWAKTLDGYRRGLIQEHRRAELETDSLTKQSSVSPPFGEQCFAAECGFLKLAQAARQRLAAGVESRASVIEQEIVAAEEDQRKGIELHAALVAEAHAALDASVGDDGGLPEANNEQAAALAELDAAKAETATLVDYGLDTHRTSVVQGERAVRFARQEHDEAMELLVRSKAMVEAAIARNEKAEELRTTLGLKEADLEGATFYAKAVGREGIPYDQMAAALPSIERWANTFLGTEELRVEIAPFAERQSGKTAPEVVISYRNGFGLHGLSAVSGYEGVAIGYALRAALARVQADSQGLELSHWYADEGWGVFDESNLILGRDMLTRLAEQFGQVFYVSHQAPIREVADTRIVIEPDFDEGSSVSVVS